MSKLPDPEGQWKVDMLESQNSVLKIENIELRNELEHLVSIIKDLTELPKLVEQINKRLSDGQ